MTIAQLDPADSAAMAQWYDLTVAVTRHDVPDFPAPSRREHLARFEHPWPATTEEALLARDGDRLVGRSTPFSASRRSTPGRSSSCRCRPLESMMGDASAIPRSRDEAVTGVERVDPGAKAFRHWLMEPALPPER
jgi:hypothetical protein